MDDLTLLQRRVLAFVKAYINNNGFPPTLREVGKGTDIKSISTVHASLNALEQKGYLVREGRSSRGIALTENHASGNVYSVPLMTVGDKSGVAFGFVELPLTFCDDRVGVFALKSPVNDLEKGILAGDIIIMKSQSTYGEHDILLGANGLAYSGEGEILGKVMGILRRY